MTNDDIIKPGSVGLHAIEEDNYVMSVCGVDDRLRMRGGSCKPENTESAEILAMGGSDQRTYKDDLTGLPLRGDLVQAAHR